MLDKKVTILSIIAIILIIIIVILCFGSNFSSVLKQETDLTITSNSTLNNGDNFTVKLTGSDGKVISNKTIYVSLTDAEGNVNNLNVTTDEKGVASFGINANSGNYSAKCVFLGDDNYDSSNVTQNISIENIVVSADSNSNSNSNAHSQSYKEYSSSNSHSQSYGSDSSSSSSSYSNGPWRSWVNDGYEYMSEKEYAERYPVLYHERTNGQGHYDIFED